MGLTSLFFIGQFIDTQHLAAVALATMYANVTGFSIGIGMSTALDTLCAQSHTGSEDPHALGKHLQRGLVVTALLTFPISIVWLFAKDLLILAGQNHEISALAGTYLVYLIPGIFPYIAYECLKRFLQGQGEGDDDLERFG